MKTNIKLLFAAALVGLTTSCTDLDVTPSSQYTEDPSKNSGVDPMIMVEAKMADVYFHLAGTFGRRYSRLWLSMVVTMIAVPMHIRHCTTALPRMPLSTGIQN